MSAMATEAMTRVEAERITLRIGLKLDSIADNYAAVMPMIREAIDRQAYAALGYASPGAYVSEKFGDSLSRLGVEIRREVVRELTEAGMSTRAIAPVVGVSVGTVHSDKVFSSEHLRSPEPVAKVTTTTEYVNTETGEVTPEPPKVTGLDGKQYSRPAPSEPRRRPLAEGFRDASLDLGKLITRIENLVIDDRFTRNKNEVVRYANDLIRARDALQCVIDQMS